jgi:hypothetical protein
MRIIEITLQIIMGIYAVELLKPWPYIPQLIAIPIIIKTLAPKNKNHVQCKLIAFSSS